MPLTKTHKQQTRERILESAVKLFSTKGFDRVSIDDLMANAGLTRGGFYAHFKNKNELYAEAIISGVKKSTIAQRYRDGNLDKKYFDLMVRGYLDQALAKSDAAPCPLAFLVTDVANREREVRAAYTKAYTGLVNVLNEMLNVRQEAKQSDFSRSIAILMIGGVAVGRALNDPQASQTLIDACYKVAGMLAEIEQ